MTELTPEEIVLKYARTPNMGGLEETPAPEAKPTETEPEEEVSPKISVLGSTMSIPNHQMIEPWMNCIVLVSLLGHGTVQAKIVGVNESHTQILVTKDDNG